MSSLNLLRIILIVFVLFACRVEANDDQSGPGSTKQISDHQESEMPVEAKANLTIDSIAEKEVENAGDINSNTSSPAEQKEQGDKDSKKDVEAPGEVEEHVNISDSVKELGSVIEHVTEKHAVSEDEVQSESSDDPKTDTFFKIPVDENPIVDNEPDDINPYPLHEIWGELLQNHVSKSGVVDYQGFKNEELQLDNYLESLSSSVPPKKSDTKETMAYWINAYNALTVKLILRNYPVESIRDLYNGNPWDVKWIDLGANKYSLNEIEHQILRPTFNDARIHFAVNCAAKSCPKLSNQAFTKDNLEAQLENLTREFVQNRTANSISRKALKLSQIFEWYAEDFGDIRQFISQYSGQSIPPKATLDYKDYDWSLNGK